MDGAATVAPYLLEVNRLVKVHMRGAVKLGMNGPVLERDKEYDVTPEQAKLLVPRYASYVGQPPADEPVNDCDLTKLTVPQLKELATQLGIELTASKKADIIGELEAAMSAGDDDGADTGETDDGAGEADGDASELESGEGADPTVSDDNTPVDDE